MIIERVVAVAFGPLEDEEIAFMPGLNVVYGPNEAAKSSLHAALFAGLCGMRRGKGQPRLEDREFQAQHRPWGGNRWCLTLTARLENGRRIELHQNLDELGQSRAIDVTTGRDVTQEIVFEGTPDASRWLGLTRRSFLATACVRQAQLLAVTEDPGVLQQELQRAAATAGRDETAAAAIERLERFHSERVGLDRANSRRPLRVAREAIRRRTAELGVAREEHARVLRLLEGAEAKEQEREELDGRLRVARAAQAEREARAAEVALQRIYELAERHPSQPEPLTTPQEHADRVAAALARWEAAPEAPALDGPSAEELRAEIAAVPEAPMGDIEVHETVRAAAERYAASRKALALHGGPPGEPDSDALEIDDSELHRLAETLSGERPSVDPTLEQRWRDAKSTYESVDRGMQLRPLVAAALLVVAGSTLLFVSLFIGVALVALGIGVTIWTLATARSGASKMAALHELREAENALGEARHRMQEFDARRQEALRRCAQLGIAADPQAVRETLDRREAARAAAVAGATWEKERMQFNEAVAVDAEGLRQALVARGVVIHTDVDTALVDYEKACKERKGTFTAAARRSELEALLTARLAAEKAASARSGAEAEVLAAAAAVGVEESELEAALTALVTWQDRQADALRHHQKALQEWRELEMLLEDRSIDMASEETARLRQAADTLAASLAPRAVQSALGAKGLDELVRQLQDAAQAAAEEVASKRGEAHEAAARAPSVAEAEEALAMAERELGRVQSLDLTLKTTLEFLKRAQERVHRDIAPTLGATLSSRLPAVTGSRYTEAVVDPQDLAVRVRTIEGAWREAARLSHGTREQIYLLLRIALSQHLVTTDEQVPLLFDEVTAHCDARRRAAVLALLHDVSRELQVIVFTHEEPVREWAEEHLVDGRDALFVRDVVAAA